MFMKHNNWDDKSTLSHDLSLYHFIHIPKSFIATTGLPTISTSFPSTVDKLSSLAAMDKPPPIFYVEVLIGGTAQLPCKIINPQGSVKICIRNSI